LPESGPFVCGQIARALARAPGRLEVDEEEAYRILDDIITWWRSGKFGPDEAVVIVDGDGHPPQRQVRPLASVLDEAQQRGEPLQLWPRLHWRDAIMLTYSAAKRYVETFRFARGPSPADGMVRYRVMPAISASAPHAVPSCLSRSIDYPRIAASRFRSLGAGVAECAVSHRDHSATKNRRRNPATALAPYTGTVARLRSGPGRSCATVAPQLQRRLRFGCAVAPRMVAGQLQRHRATSHQC
jgi:hypothetical protein